MPHFILVAVFYFLFSNLSAQVYHYQTGKTIPVSKPGQIIWKKGVYFNYPADFGTLIVNENPAKTKSKLINLPVIRINCINTDSVLEPIFILNGGPGESNIQTYLIFNSLLEKHDIILMGYRGVDGSVILSSNFYVDALFTDTLSTANYTKVFSQAASKTLANIIDQKVDIQGYSMENVVNDIETIRLNQNYPKLSFVAYSYGTMLAQLYVQLFPQQVNKMALIGARPFGNFRINDTLFRKQAYSIFKAYKFRNQEPDSSELDFEKLFAICENNSFLDSNQLNPIRFRIFFYSQFYSVKKANELFAALTNNISSQQSSISRKYKEFYQSYPNIEMSDIFLKKQNYFECTIADTLSSNITNSLIETINDWYSPCQEYFNKITDPFFFTPSQVSALFICAKFDIAAPFSLISKLQHNLYYNSDIKIIDHCGHLDLFYEQKPQLDSLIYNYFQGN